MAGQGSKLYIHVGYGDMSSQAGGAIVGSPGAQSAKQTSSKAKSGARFFSRFVAMKMARETLQVGMQFVNQKIDTMGQRAGEYQRQADAQFAMSMASRIGGAAVSAGISAATGNYWAAGIILASTAVDFIVGNTVQVMNNEIALNNSALNSGMVRSRAGLDSATNNNRGTEN